MFRFSLQPVLQHREHIEENAQRRVAEARGRVDFLSQEIAACDQSMASLAARWGQESESTISAARQELFAAWQQEIRRRRGELRAQQAEALTELKEAQVLLTGAHRDVRRFELLRDRARLEHDREIARGERMMLDEFSVMRHTRRRTGATREEVR
jgi:flagellar export protein FliJ